MGRPLFALGAMLGAVVSTFSVTTAAATSSASGSSSGHGPTLTVVSQTPWVGPGQSMQLHIATTGAPTSSLSLSLTLYQHLTSRSAFALTEAGTSVGPTLGSATVDVSSLPTDPNGGVDVTIPVTSGDAPASGTGPLEARLVCQPNSCGGVYPLRLQLSSSDGGGRTQLFTYLVYANTPSDTQKLRLAWLLPVALPPSALTGSTSGPSSSQTDHLAGLLAAVGAHAGVPVTFAPEPAAVVALGASAHPKGRTVVSSLQSLAGSGHQVLESSFVPVDAAALVDQGLSGELTDQVRRADQVLSPLRASADTWMAGGSLDQAALSSLGALGFDHLVLPSSAVQEGSSPLTPSQPIEVGSRGISAAAVISDSGLAGDLASADRSGAALAGYRMLADLALIYYEQPNRFTPRGVLAVSSSATQVDPSSVDTVLGALSTDPLVAPVTVDDLFSQVPLASGSPRRLQSPSGTGTLPARQIRAGRAKLSAFASSVDAAGAATVRGLDDRLLVAEDDDLRAVQQARQVTTAMAGLGQQLSALSVRADTIRLTSSAARVPITVLKQAGYGVTARLTVTGDKVQFPSGTAQNAGSVCRSVKVHSSAGRSTFSCLADIGHATNAVYVDMRARVSGDFRLTVTLASPLGSLVLATNHVTVRSMSSSVVAVVLSAAAVVVLLVWWGRTLWRGHPAPGRGAHARRRRPTRGPQE